MHCHAGFKKAWIYLDWSLYLICKSIGLCFPWVYLKCMLYIITFMLQRILTKLAILKISSSFRYLFRFSIALEYSYLAWELLKPQNCAVCTMHHQEARRKRSAHWWLCACENTRALIWTSNFMKKEFNVWAGEAHCVFILIFHRERCMVLSLYHFYFSNEYMLRGNFSRDRLWHSLRIKKLLQQLI